MRVLKRITNENGSVRKVIVMPEPLTERGAVIVINKVLREADQFFSSSSEEDVFDYSTPVKAKSVMDLYVEMTPEGYKRFKKLRNIKNDIANILCNVYNQPLPEHLHKIGPSEFAIISDDDDTYLVYKDFTGNETSSLVTSSGITPEIMNSIKR